MKKRYEISKVIGKYSQYRIKDNEKCEDSEGKLYTSFRKIHNFVKNISIEQGKPASELCEIVEDGLYLDQKGALDIILNGNSYSEIKIKFPSVR